MTKTKKKYFTKLTKETIDKLFQEISRGVPIKHACTLAGISKETYYHWTKVAKELPDDLTEDDENYLYKYFEQKKEEGIAMAVVTQFNEELGIMCYKATAPEKKFNTVKVKYENQIERDIPTNYTWDVITFSFIERKDYLIYNLFNEWLDGMHNPITNTGRFYNEIISDVKINFLNKDNEVMAYYSLIEAKPVGMTMSELTWETNDQFVSIDVDFSYIYPTNKDFELTSLVNSVMDFGSSDVVNTLKDVINVSWKGMPSIVKKIF